MPRRHTPHRDNCSPPGFHSSHLNFAINDSLSIRDITLIGNFSLQSEALTEGRFLVDQGDGEAAAGVAGGGPGVVLLSPAGHVFRDPGVQRPVATAKEIDEPLGAGPFRHPILSLRLVALSAVLRAGGFESTA